MPFLTSRSAIKEYHRCPRARYFQYHYDGTGIVPASKSIPLVVGGAVHVGLEGLILGKDLEIAVSETLAEFDKSLQGQGFEPDSEVTDSYYVYQEQRALVEALIRAFYYRGLGPFLEEYEVLETEREVPLELFPEGILESRADGLLRKKSTGELYILSWKTANSYDRRKEKDNETDDQGLSEWAAMNRRLNDIGHSVYIGDYDDVPEWHRELDDIQISGVQMVYLKKGTRTEYPSDSGRWYQNSHLVRPWMKDSFPAPEFAWSWDWQDETGNHRLGKGWRKVNIWEVMPIKDWIDLLDSGRVQSEAGDPLGGVVIMPPPYYRRPEEIEDWVEQVAFQEASIAASLNGLDRNLNEKNWLNRAFPQHRRSCNYPVACSYKKLCFGPVQIESALESGYYVRRESHHQLEREKFNVGGGETG